MTDTTSSRKRHRSNGEGGVWFEKSRNRWVGAVTVGYDSETGKQRRRTVSAKTKIEALERLREVQAADDKGMTPARKDLTVAQFLEDWSENVLPGTVAASTLTQYRDVVRLYIVPHLGRIRLRQLSPRDVTKMIRELEKLPPTKTRKTAGVSANTRRLARSVLRRALRYAQAEGLLERNAAAIADGVKLESTEGRTLSPEDARKLLAHISGDRLEAAYTVALSLGLRRGELLGLSWSDVDLEGKPPKLTVRRSLKRIRGTGLVLDEPKTKGSRRTVHLPGPVVAALKAHRVRQLEDRLAAGDLWIEKPLEAELVFRSPIGTALDPDNFRNATYSITEAAGLGRWSPHELRHSAASLLIAQGVPLKVISETLGHSSIRITADVYGHLLEPARAEASDAMEAALWG